MMRLLRETIQKVQYDNLPNSKEEREEMLDLAKNLLTTLVARSSQVEIPSSAKSEFKRNLTKALGFIDDAEEAIQKAEMNSTTQA